MDWYEDSMVVCGVDEERDEEEESLSKFGKPKGPTWSQYSTAQTNLPAASIPNPLEYTSLDKIIYYFSIFVWFPC